MKAVLRAVVTTLALTLVVGVGAVAAASPEPTIGGKLSAVGNTVTVESQGSVPVQVTMTADVVKLADYTFDLKPGESHELAFTGDPLGRIYATFSSPKDGATAADGSSLTLSIGLKPYVPPFDWAPIFWLALIALAVVFLTWRAVRWGRRHIRIVHPEVTP